MHGALAVRVASPGDCSAWDDYVASDDAATLYHLYGWRGIFREVFGCDTSYLLAEGEVGIEGLLPLFVVRKALLGGNYVSSLPGGICAGNTAAGRELIHAAIGLTRERGARYLKLRDTYQKWDDERLQSQTEHKYILRDLPSDPDVIWKTVKHAVRKAVRKAHREGLRALWGTENLDGFYHVYTATMRDFGTPALPRAFFQRSLDEFPDNVRILTILFDDTVIASGFLFAFKGVLHCPFLSSLRQFFGLCAMDLATWEIIKHACEGGFRAVDMGRSAPDTGQARYKEKFLARSSKVFYQYYLNTASGVPASRGSRLYPIVSPIWRHLPLPIANRLGPVVRRVIPLG